MRVHLYSFFFFSSLHETQEDLENFGKNLQYLNISGNSVSVSDAKLLAEKLKSNQNLLALKLHNCDLNIDSIIQIFEALRTPPPFWGF